MQSLNFDPGLIPQYHSLKISYHLHGFRDFSEFSDATFLFSFIHRLSPMFVVIWSIAIGRALSEKNCACVKREDCENKALIELINDDNLVH